MHTVSIWQHGFYRWRIGRLKKCGLITPLYKFFSSLGDVPDAVFKALLLWKDKRSDKTFYLTILLKSVSWSRYSFAGWTSYFNDNFKPLTMSGFFLKAIDRPTVKLPNLPDIQQWSFRNMETATRSTYPEGSHFSNVWSSQRYNLSRIYQPQEFRITIDRGQTSFSHFTRLLLIVLSHATYCFQCYSVQNT